MVSLIITPSSLLVEVDGVSCRAWNAVSNDPSVPGSAIVYVQSVFALAGSPMEKELAKSLVAMEAPILPDGFTHHAVSEILRSLSEVEAVAAALLWESASNEQIKSAKAAAFRLLESQKGKVKI